MKTSIQQTASICILTFSKRIATFVCSGYRKQSECGSKSEREHSRRFFPRSRTHLPALPTGRQAADRHSHFLTECCYFSFKENEFFGRVASRNNHFYRNFNFL